MQDHAAIGALIGVGFAFGWALAGALHLSSALWRSLALCAAAILTLVIAGALLWRWRSVPVAASPLSSGHFDGVSYGLAVAFEALTIPAAVVLLRRAGRQDLILPAVAGIVGLHFFGLARALGGGSLFGWVGAAMCILSLLALWRGAPARTDFWAALVGLGCTAILWVAALSALW